MAASCRDGKLSGMTTQTARAPGSRALLMLKAQGDFKHSGKYYLLNGRWHSLSGDAKAPKGAPVASHPHAAGKHEPAKHLQDHEWDKLKLPDSNTNAGTHNKKLDQLKEHSEAGHVTGILGMQIGQNTYGHKIAKVANHLLGLHGSEHKVVAGQKAGEHPAVNQAPAATSSYDGPLKDPSQKAKADDYLSKIENASSTSSAKMYAELFMDLHNEQGQSSALVMVASAMNSHKAKLAAQSEAPAPPAKPGDQVVISHQNADYMNGLWSVGSQEGNFLNMSGPDGKTLNLHASSLAAMIEDKHAAVRTPKAAGAESKVPNAPEIPEFQEGKQAKGVTHYYETLAQSIKEMAEAGDVDGLKQLQEHGLQPNAKGKVGNTWKGKTANSKTLIDYHSKLLEHAGGKPEKAPEPKPEPKAPQPQPAPTSKVSQIPWSQFELPESNTNAKSVNKKLAAIKDATEAGDIAALEGMKFGKNTYNKKLAKVAQLAIAGLKEDQDAPESESQHPLLYKISISGSASVAENNAFKYVESQGKTKESYQKAAGELSQHGYHKQAQTILSAMPAEKQYIPPDLDVIDGGAEDDEPKEGDTKEGADGTLVFHNGRWHKQDKGVAQKQEISGFDALALPDGSIIEITHEGKFFRRAMIQGSDVYLEKKSGKGWMKKPLSPQQTGWFASGEYGTYTLVSKPDEGETADQPAHNPVTDPEPAGNEPEPMDAWEQTGPQGGSNPGGRYKASDGSEWYCKFPSNEDHAKSEVLAAKLYAAAGISGQDAKLITKGGKLGIASRWTDVSKTTPSKLAKTEGAFSGFAVDAWLGNWDVIGAAFDNLQVDKNGKAVRIDAGGSLTYRAQGAKKAFGATVSELDSLRDPKINPQAAAVFGGMTKADITASVAKVANFSDDKIMDLVGKFGPGDDANKKALADTLIARKNDLVAKHPKAAKPGKKRLNPNKLPVDPEKLPDAHDFSNWNGPGQGLSSKPHVNQANMSVEQEMFALAKSGNLTKLKNYQFPQIDKETGNATGSKAPISQHPSKHVVQLHADLVQHLDEIANPPRPLKIIKESDASTLEDLSAAFPSKPIGTTVGKVKSNEKLGFWVVLGGTHAVEKFKPAKVQDFSKAAISAGHAKFQEAPPLAKHFIKSVQASGSYNDLFRNGEEADASGNKLTDVAKAAHAYATTQPEGTSLYRWQNMPDAMVKKILSAPDGTVFQATGPMCTSYSSSATSGFGKHRVVVRYAKGAKAVESFGSGKFSGEKEVTTLPGSRFVILKKEMVADHKHPGQKRMELEVLMLPPDPQYTA